MTNQYSMSRLGTISKLDFFSHTYISIAFIVRKIAHMSEAMALPCGRSGMRFNAAFTGKFDQK